MADHHLTEADPVLPGTMGLYVIRRQLLYNGLLTHPLLFRGSTVNYNIIPRGLLAHYTSLYNIDSVFTLACLRSGLGTGGEVRRPLLM